jgi:hypothetical protein
MSCTQICVRNAKRSQRFLCFRTDTYTSAPLLFVCDYVLCATQQQFITALFVSVYYRTFIRPHTISVGTLIAQASLLTSEQRQELMHELSKLGDLQD